jgi:hypothetical protein
MSISLVLHQFAADATVKAVLVMIALNLVLGVAAAVHNSSQQFSLAKVGLFLRDDVLGKVVPWFAVYAMWKLAPDVSVIGLDLEVIEKGVFVIVVAALVGSMTSSLADLGLKVPLPLSLGKNA